MSASPAVVAAAQQAMGEHLADFDIEVAAQRCRCGLVVGDCGRSPSRGVGVAGRAGEGGGDVSDYQIEFSIQRRLPGESDFTEVGFGSSGAWSSVEQAVHMVDSAIQSREWETTPGMPDPDDLEDQ